MDDFIIISNATGFLSKTWGLYPMVYTNTRTLELGNYIYYPGTQRNSSVYDICRKPKNSAPSVSSVTLEVDEDTRGSLVLEASDPDANDTATFTIVTPPGKGSAAISGSRLNFIPPANWNGTTQLTYKATDSFGASSNIGTITIIVRPVNDAPTISDVTLTIDEDTVGYVNLVVTDIDLDYEGDAHTFSIASQPSTGTATISGNKVTYKPPVNWYGNTSMTYKVTDRAGATDTATIFIVVNPINDAPIAQDLALKINEDTSGSVTLSATDVDSPPSSIFQIVGKPDATVGSVSLVGSIATFTPAPNWNGSTFFTYRAQDSSGAWSELATVTIIVVPVNDRPTAGGKITIHTLENLPASVRTTVLTP
ncbi:tandem-95 repeat protein [Metapseudomonas otitidis]|uniref:tandem-95 repeat protein n=1 Tax=Metapseudomonas otitidis TaxID=319939 RepID=UPI0013F6806B|nr:Ig-like domain-containing protein [Pseudomonas otitidis]